jgi:4-hydroxybenzoate polyprenyltransferase
MLGPLVESARPRQWTKNCFVFAAPLFSKKFFTDPSSILVALGAFVLFSAASSAAYLINDVVDYQSDRNHPKKRQRAIPSGRLSRRTATLAAALFLVVSLGCGLFMAWGGVSTYGLPLILLVYTILITAYSFWLKQVVILDVLVLAIGFVLRAMAGAEAVKVEISPWLYVCTILISLFLALSKRRHEMVLLEGNASVHRPILREYSPYLLDQLISVVTASTVVVYMLYTMDPSVILKLETDKLLYTSPFVIYGIFRYLYLVHQKLEGGDPSELILADRPLLGCIFLWVIAVAILLALGGR